MTDRFVIGIDYGTLSARAVVCRTSDGAVMGEAESVYPHAILYDHLPDGTPLPPEWALQHPQDYLDALYTCVPAAMKQSGVPRDSVIGIAVDFTGSTPMPLASDGQPLCFHAEYAGRPHAYVKLWKHHSAVREAEELNELASRYAPELLASMGGRISTEVFFAKLIQVLHEDPELFRAIDQWMEAGDWVTQQLTGESTRSMAAAINKGFYRIGIGYPAFIEETYPELRGMRNTILRGELCPIASVAGHLTAQMAERLGLPAGIVVPPMHLDAHAAVPALGVTGPGHALYTLGTSTGFMLVQPDFHAVEGACSITYSGMLPDCYGYANGQASAGDQLAWFVDHCVPASVSDEAARRGMSLHQLLTERAAALAPGQSGLIALDWWNGNRSVLQNTGLSGLMVGMTLQTQPHEMYRALLESIAFGVRRIIEAHSAAGIEMDTVHLAGGISYKNPLLVQMVSDVTGKRLLGSKRVSAPAVGAAILAAVAAGAYKTIAEAAAHMNCLSGQEYHPNAAASAVYDQLYAEYVRLHDYFGRGENDVMLRLRRLAAEQSGKG